MSKQLIDHLEDTTYVFHEDPYHLHYSETSLTPLVVVTNSDNIKVTQFESKGSTHADLCYLEGFLTGYDDGYSHGNFEGDQRGFNRGFNSN